MNTREISSANVLEEPTAPDESEGPPPKLSRLEYEIGGSARVPTFGDLIAQASADPKEQYDKMPSRPLRENVPGEDIVQATLDQCKSAREPREVGGQAT